MYGVRWRPGAVSGQGAQITTASYDRILRTIDVSTGSLIRTFSGHSQTTLCVAYDPAGSLLASGAKDRQVRLWDAIGGVCVNTMTACLGEVTSVEFDNHGRYLLVGSKDNSNRLWDLRMVSFLFLVFSFSLVVLACYIGHLHWRRSEIANLAKATELVSLHGTSKHD